MATAAKSRLSFVLNPDADASLCLSRRVANSLRQAVLSGQCPPGSRLPSTRGLAAELGVSRNTVLDAYSELLAEGYLEGRIGSGTFVSAAVREEFLRARTPTIRSDRRPRPSTLSRRGAGIADAYKPTSADALRPFNPGLPQLDPPLFAAWWRLAARLGRHTSADMLNYGDPAGYRPLREAIAAHIGTARGIRCTPDRVIVTAGTQQALALICHLLLDPGDLVWMEDPGYGGASAALRSAAARVVPIEVDEEGMNVGAAVHRAPRARMAYVSPSHQYPLSVTMSLARRLRLLDWAARSGAWVLEDDYDSEFRHGERPLPTLHSLDAAARVIYIGTFSKVLFPAIRLGYVVVPDDLVESFRQAQLVLGNRAPTMDQATLAAFIVEGHFTRHVRLMRRRYQELRSILDEAICRRVGSALRLTGVDVGLHAVGRLADGIDDRDVSRRAATAGVDAPALSTYYVGAAAVSALVLGYGHLDPASIRSGVDRLAAVIHDVQPRRISRAAATRAPDGTRAPAARISSPSAR